jgi:hypothetical protein
MIPVTQTEVGDRGNCLSACVASLLEIPIECVPNFTSEPHEPPGMQPIRLNEWLSDLGLRAVYCMTSTMHHDHATPDGFYIITGFSPRGRPHVVIGHGKQIAHDPHPSRAGLVSIDGLILICPA